MPLHPDHGLIGSTDVPEINAATSIICSQSRQWLSRRFSTHGTLIRPRVLSLLSNVRRHPFDAIAPRLPRDAPAIDYRLGQERHVVLGGFGRILGVGFGQGGG